jgi:hypothetical protein
MPKTNETDIANRSRIKTLSDEGYSSRELEEKTYSTVNYTLRCLKNSKTLENLEKSGRPHVTTSATDRKIVELVNESESPNSVDIAKNLEELNLGKISDKTVRRRLCEAEFQAKTTTKKPFLNPQHIKARYDYGLRASKLDR